jgi:hypothetical protein
VRYALSRSAWTNAAAGTTCGTGLACVTGGGCAKVFTKATGTGSSDILGRVGFGCERRMGGGRWYDGAALG